MGGWPLGGEGPQAQGPLSQPAHLPRHASGACVGGKGSEHDPGRERKKTLGCSHQRALPAASLKDKVETNRQVVSTKVPPTPHCDLNVTVTSHLRRSPAGGDGQAPSPAPPGSAKHRQPAPHRQHGAESQEALQSHELKSQRSQMAPELQTWAAQGGSHWPCVATEISGRI